jgi:hypothetical protein
MGSPNVRMVTMGIVLRRVVTGVPVKQREQNFSDKV